MWIGVWTALELEWWWRWMVEVEGAGKAGVCV